jgi:putative membrane protein
LGHDVREGTRRRYDDGTRFSYTQSLPEWLATIRQLEPRDVDGFFRFMELGARLFEISKETFLRRRPGDAPDLRSIRALRHLPLHYGWGNYHRTVEAHFKSPLLRQLYNRYPTYVGSSPYLSPATLAVIPYSDFLRLVLIALCGLMIEALGVSYGWPFGAYRYMDVLQPKLFSVPLVMACAWMVLVAYLKQMMRHLSLHAWAKALLAALWMTAIDLVIDPLAAHQLGYWRWTGTGAYYGIPASNFVGWFVLIFLIFCIVRREWKENYRASLIGSCIVLFFTLIALAHRLFLAGVVGLMLCALHVLIYRFSINARRHTRLFCGLYKSARNG